MSQERSCEERVDRSETGRSADGDRSRLDGGDRGNPTPQWEVFIRQTPTDPLTHVGSVAATSSHGAHDHASRLFELDATDIWCCPAAAVDRYATRGVGVSESESGERTDRPDGGDPTDRPDGGSTDRRRGE